MDEAGLRLDFENLPHLAFSKPLKLAYFGKELIGPCAWRELYVRLVEALYVDFPRRFVPGLSFVSASSIQIDFGNQKMSFKMRSPQKLSIEGQSMFLETNLSADSIALRIKKLLDRCDVDYEDVEIKYAAASSERTKKADNRASTTQIERKEKRPDKREAQIAEEAKTKFVRNAKDQAIMKADPDAFRSVYYALKEKVRTNPEGCTATDIFLALNGKYKRKQIIEILQTASWANKVNDYSFLFYDEQREEKKQQQTEEKAQSIEQEFFAWLPTAVPPGRISELKRNIPAVDAVLQQRKFLPQPLFLTTKLCNVEAAEIQARRKLPSQKQKDMASELLRAYAAFLREKKKTLLNSMSALRIQKNQSSSMKASLTQAVNLSTRNLHLMTISLQNLRLKKIRLQRISTKYTHLKRMQSSRLRKSSSSSRESFSAILRVSYL